MSLTVAICRLASAGVASPHLCLCLRLQLVHEAGARAPDPLLSLRAMHGQISMV